MTGPGEVKREEVIDTSERRNVILMALYSFYKMEREEVSLPEFLECIKRLQERIPLRYEFSERFLYSSDLMGDLRDLEYRGFVHRFTYRHDAFLPKSYITLTGFGRSRAKKVAQKFPEEFTSILDECISATIESYREKWRLYARTIR